MALNNTTDRYNYIYGNTARKLERTSNDYRRTQSTSPLKEDPDIYRSPAKKSKSRQLVKINDAFDWKYLVMIILAVAVVACGALYTVRETAHMNDLAAQIKELKDEKTDLQSRQASIQSELDKAVNLDQISEYAEKNLDMVYPDHDNVIYYYQDSSDYFRQYESVDK